MLLYLLLMSFEEFSSPGAMMSIVVRGRCRKTDVKIVDEHGNHRIGDLCWFIIIQSLLIHRLHMISSLKNISRIMVIVLSSVEFMECENYFEIKVLR